MDDTPVAQSDPTVDQQEIYDDSWSSLPRVVKFAVLWAALVFLGVVLEGILLTPSTLVLHGWIPAPQDKDNGTTSAPQVPGQLDQPGDARSPRP